MADPADSDLANKTVAEVLADVEAGKVTAQEALDVEQARGDDARSTLVEKLQAAVAGPGGEPSSRALVVNTEVDGTWYGPAHGNADQVPADVAERITNSACWSE